jgi:hypothetical protein
MLVNRFNSIKPKTVNTSIDIPIPKEYMPSELLSPQRFCAKKRTQLPKRVLEDRLLQDEFA